MRRYECAWFRVIIVLGDRGLIRFILLGTSINFSGHDEPIFSSDRVYNLIIQIMPMRAHRHDNDYDEARIVVPPGVLLQKQKLQRLLHLPRSGATGPHHHHHRGALPQLLSLAAIAYVPLPAVRFI